MTTGVYSAEFGEAAYFNEANLRYDTDLNTARLDGLDPKSHDSIGQAYRSALLPGAGHFFEQAGKGYWNQMEYPQASDSFRNTKVEYEKEGKYREARSAYLT